MSSTTRNVAIIVVLAAVVAFVPAAGHGTRLLLDLLQLVFLGSLGFLGWRLYLEHRVALYSLGDRTRGILYGSIAAIALMLIGRGRLWSTGAGTAVWFVLIGGGIFGLYTVWRASRAY